jgi:hypothetical protein
MAKQTQTVGTKTCTKCGITKDITEFYKRGGKVSPNTRHNHCKECTKSRVSKTYWDDPSVYQNNHLKRNYGITLNDYNQMLTEQKHQCAVCGTTEPGGKHGKFMVDHCHKTGKVRGLLCKSCNIALGEVGDNTQTLQSMIEYLQEH